MAAALWEAGKFLSQIEPFPWNLERRHLL
jgi:hypothetical protein